MKSVPAVTSIFKKSWSFWRHVWLASSYSSKYWKITLGKFLPTDLTSLFKIQQRLSSKKLGANMVKMPPHNPIFLQKSFCGKVDRRGIAPSVQNGACSWSAKKKLPQFDLACKTSWFLFQSIPIFVGDLAQNSTRFYLSNGPLLLIRSCAYNMPSFLLLFHANNTLNITFKHETIALKIFWCVSLFFLNFAWSHIFTRIFGNSKFSKKTKIMLMFVQKQTNSGNSGDFLER